jgi:hypothetical protein
MNAAGRLSYDITTMDGGMIDVGFGCVCIHVVRYWLDTLLMVLLRIAQCMTDLLSLCDWSFGMIVGCWLGSEWVETVSS